jgi:hypothetical protein
MIQQTAREKEAIESNYENLMMTNERLANTNNLQDEKLA